MHRCRKICLKSLVLALTGIVLSCSGNDSSLTSSPSDAGSNTDQSVVVEEDGGQSYGDSKSVGADASGCINQCTLGAKQCIDIGWQECIEQANGCTNWGEVTDCNNGEICSGGLCRKNCINQCTEGARQCSGNGYVTCAEMTTGCTDWGETTACNAAAGEVCSGGKCVKNCVNQCSLGDKQCSGTGVQECQTMASGCTDWGNPVPCELGQICSGGKCADNCTNQCEVGKTRCSGTNIQTCKVMSSGCTDWDTPQPCANGSCVNGKCDSGVCQKGERRCNGTTVEECDSGGYWVVFQICPQACDKGACTLKVTCEPVSRRCNNNIVEECNPTGTAWLYVRSCLSSCDNGLCTGECNPGEKRCNGKVVEVCKTDGSGWQTETTCNQTFCTNGGCAELELKLDNTTVTLDGEHVYVGDVLLKNNSLITVGPKGWLRLRARNIGVDSTSAIEAPPVGNDPRGQGGLGGLKSCQSSSCSSGVSSNIFGGGGGYGTAGQGVSTSLYNCYYSNYCTIQSSGGAVFGGFVADISVGSAGGSCNKPNGGGMIDLIASQTMVISGNLKVNGGSSADGGGGYCSGGSGGGIRLVAEELGVNGILSADGGSPNGGQGRIKFLYGSKKNISATTKGVVETSLIPPIDLRSSTHPDSSHYYNDDFDVFHLAWSRPFSNLASYYYDLTKLLPTSQNQVPYAQSTYHVGESVSLSADKLKAGSNYFNIISVGPTASFGTVEGAFSLRINDKPPIVSSSSHPSSAQWYTLPTAVFSWVDPVSSDNFIAYYYMFDRYADTIPTKSDHKLSTSDKQLLMPNLPPGTIWFLHLLAEDTMGYLTKAAQHFKVQVGPAPSMGGISGDIRETGSDPPKLLSEVKILLNRGLQTTTSSSGGQYFFSNNVYAGSYELRAIKEGYETFITQVTVAANQNTSLNIQLKKVP